MKFFKKIKNSIRLALGNMGNLGEKLDDIKINQGIILANLNKGNLSRDLGSYEFKVFSQWGEDGIIQHLIESVEIKNKTFIEFGVQDFYEANCRFLLMKDNWQGFVIDGSSKNIQKLKDSYFFWKYQIDALDVFITKDNINGLLKKSNFEEDLGILSIDLDGNDYYILEAINEFKPRILICEYNPNFGTTRKICTPYQADFYRTNAHYSNLYWGASLGAMTYLANNIGYELVGIGSSGNNAFYVRKDLINDKLQVISCEEVNLKSYSRESRDQNGNLTFLSGEARFNLIKGLPVMNVEEGVMESL